MKHLRITLTNSHGHMEYDATHGIQGDPTEQLEDALACFEDYFSMVHEIPPEANSLDFVDAVELN